MKVERGPDCGNSPKNAFAADVAVALLAADAKALDAVLAPDARLQFVRRGSAEDRPAAVSAPPFGAPRAIEIQTVATHGRAGAVSGVLRTSSGLQHFCLVLRFASAKADRVASVQAYLPT
ncbi:MAG TPA: hypothetical protein VF699_07500 [Caulobacteraceae bacterium]